MTKKYFMGMDISKGYADITIIDQGRNVIEPVFQLDDTFDGHSMLYSVLSKLFQNNKGATLYAAMESTGGYENNWYEGLLRAQIDFPVKVARLNALGVHYNTKADLKRVITDSEDARNIANFLISHPDKVEYNKDDQFKPVRELRRFIRKLKAQKVQLLNQLESLYYSAFPEIAGFCKGGVPRWVLILLKQYPTAQRLAKARAATVSKIPYISFDRAGKLINLAQKSVASSRGEITECVVKATVEQILNLQKTIDEQIRLMKKHCNIPDLEIITSFCGIAEWTGIGLIIELGNIERFSTVKKLVSYCGINPAFKQSGDGVHKIRMSKQGRIEPRRLLYMAVLGALKWNPVIKETYARHVRRGMNKQAAIGVCMHKALRIIYGMLKSKTKFDPEIYRKKSIKIKKVKTNTDNGKKRRYQVFDKNAPISKRQNKKRKAGNMHQNDKIIENGVIESDLT